MIPEDPATIKAYADESDRLTLMEALAEIRMYNNLEMLLSEGLRPFRRLCINQQMSCMDSAMTVPPTPQGQPHYKLVPEYWYGRADLWNLLPDILQELLRSVQAASARFAPQEPELTTEAEEREGIPDGSR